MFVHILILVLLLQNAVGSELRDGLLALNHGDLPGARRALEAAAELDSANAVVWAALAQVYLKSNEKSAALQAAAKAETLEPGNPAIQHALAMFYTGEGEPRKAAAFERQFASSPKADPEALSRAVKLYLQAGETANAIEAAQADVAEHDGPGQHYLLGQAYEAGNQLPRAIEEYRAALTLAPDTQEFSFLLARSLLRLGKFADAAVVLQTAAGKFPDDPQFCLALGVANYGLRRFPEAVHSFVKTIELAPDLEQPFLFLGKILDQAGNSLPEIQAKVEQFQRRHPESYLGSFLLAKLIVVAGGPAERTEALLRESVRINAGLWESHADLGEALSRRGSYTEAAREFELAAQLNATEPSIPFRLARVYDRLAQPAKAVEQRARHKRLLAMPKTDTVTEKP